MNLKIENTRIKTTSDYDPRILLALNKLEGMKRWGKGRVLSFENSHFNLAVWRSVFPGATIEGPPTDGKALPGPPEGAGGLFEAATDRPCFRFKTPPRAHQRSALAKIGERPAAGLFMDIGTGKSFCGVALAAQRWCAGLSEHLLLIAPSGVHTQWVSGEDSPFQQHMSEIVPWRAWIYRKGNRRALEAYEKLLTFEGLKIFVINIDALGADYAEPLILKFLNAAGGKATIYVDECFEKGTMISTPFGKKPIETIMKGDLVDSTSGIREVKEVSIKKSSTIKVVLENGVSINCTGNHKFFTDIGWVEASKLDGRRVFDAKSVRILLEGTCSEEEQVLQQILLSEMENTVSSRIQRESLPEQGKEFENIKFAKRYETSNYCSNEIRGSFASIRSRQNFSNDQEDRSQTKDNRRERERISGSAKTIIDSFTKRFSSGGGNNFRKILGGWLSKLLQSGYRFAGKKNGNRSGWWNSQYFEGKGKRQKERQKIRGIGVDCIEVKQQICPVNVFNLEVEGSPHYYANGILVHNCQLIKSISARRTKAALKFSALARYKLIMTGTPIAKDLVDLYSQFKFLDEQIIGQHYITTFKNRYCEFAQTAFGPKIVGHKNVEELYRKIDPYIFRITSAEALDLPPKMFIRRTFELKWSQIEIMNDLRANFFALFGNDDQAIVKNAIGLLTRLQQVSCGFIPNDKGEIVNLDNPRLDALLSIIEQRSDKLIVWCRFQQDIRNVSAALGAEAVTYYGPDTEAERAVNKARFIEDEKVRWLVASPATAGTGLDGLQRVCTTNVYYSNSFSSLHRWQSEGRTWRDGTSKSVAYFDLVAKKSPDNFILKNLQEKKDISDLTLDQCRNLLEFKEIPESA